MTNPLNQRKKHKKTTATFFAIHYGFFHLVYSVFLFDQRHSFSSNTLIFILLCVVIFFFNHRFSYFHNRERDMNRVPNIGTIMFFPYLRIIPMTLTIIFGSMFTRSMFAKGSIITLLLFLVLKTFADLVMHMIEHAQARQKKN